MPKKLLLFLFPALIFSLFACRGVQRLIDGPESKNPNSTSQTAAAQGAHIPRDPHNKHGLVLYDRRTGFSPGYSAKTAYSSGLATVTEIVEKGRRYLLFRDPTPCQTDSGFHLIGPPIDIRNFKDGTIRFSIRLSAPLTSPPLRAGYFFYNDTAEPPAGSAIFGLNPNSTAWQSVSVPIGQIIFSEFWDPPPDRITEPFQIFYQNPDYCQPIGWEIDQVELIPDKHPGPPTSAAPAPSASPSPAS